MSELVGLWAEIRVPTAAVAAWLSSTVDAHRWDDWCAPFDEALPDAPSTVKALLDGATGRVEDPSFVDVRIEGESVRVRAGVGLDDELDVCGELAVALRAAEGHGGEGDVVFVYLQGSGPTVRVRIAEGASLCAKAKRADARSKKAIADVMDASLEHVPAAEREARAALERKAAGDHELATSHPELRALRERALAAVASHPEAAIGVAAKESWLTVFVGSTSYSFTKLAAAKVVPVLRMPLPAGSRDPQNFYRAPLELLALLDRGAADAIAVATIALDVPFEFRFSAGLMLSGSRDRATAAQLVRLLHDSRDELASRGKRVAAVVRSIRLDSVPEAILPLLTKELMDSLSRSGHNHPSYPHATNLLSVLGAYAYRPGQEALAAVYREHPSESVRMWAGRCLLLDGEPPTAPKWPAPMPPAQVKTEVDELLKRRHL
jgi:hypothetical protein